MKFAVNVSTIFTEAPFLARFAKAKQHGFSHVECQFPYSVAPEAIADELEQLELSLVLLNLPAGDWENGGARARQFFLTVMMNSGVHWRKECVMRSRSVCRIFIAWPECCQGTCRASGRRRRICTALTKRLQRLLFMV